MPRRVAGAALLSGTAILSYLVASVWAGDGSVTHCEGPGQVDLASGTWCCERVGDGSRHLVLFLGGLGTAARVPPSFRGLGDDWTVWAVVHPPIGSLDEVSGGVVEFVERRGLSRIHLFGASVGGAVVQDVVRRAPDRVQAVLLANSAPPLGSSVIHAAGLILRPVLAGIPDGWLEGWVRRKLAAVAGTPEGGAEVEGHGLGLDTVTAAHIRALTALVLEFHRRSWSASDLDGWSGRMLILESDDDPMVPPRYRARLKALYPRARVHTFAGGGHLPSVRAPDEYQTVVRSFLEPEAS